MSYYKSYDAYGEPRSILPLRDEPRVESRNDKWEREALACINADDLYETLRHEGLSHADARARVAERFGV